MSTEPNRRTPVVPWAAIVAVLSFLAGIALLYLGIYILAGLGWAVLAACIPCFLLALVIQRGLSDG